MARRGPAPRKPRGWGLPAPPPWRRWFRRPRGVSRPSLHDPERVDLDLRQPALDRILPIGIMARYLTQKKTDLPAGDDSGSRGTGGHEPQRLRVSGHRYPFSRRARFSGRLARRRSAEAPRAMETLRAQACKLAVNFWSRTGSGDPERRMQGQNRCIPRPAGEPAARILRRRHVEGSLREPSALYPLPITGDRPLDSDFS